MPHRYIVGEKYQIKRKIGHGSFGEIYLAVDLVTGERVAAKVERLNAKHPQLVYEFKVYRALNCRGVPNIRWFGEVGKCNCMIMDLLGDSLETLFTKCGRRFSLKTILMLTIQLIDRIQDMHDNNFIHRDIKPDNFLMGVGRRQEAVFLIDMGLSKHYIDPRSQQHIPYRDSKKLTGTPRYASLNTHYGIEQCRRDDLESLGYMLVYFQKGNLPWQGLKAETKQEKYDKIGQKKTMITIKTLCKDLPVEFAHFLQYCRGLEFEEKPNYLYLRGMFAMLFRKNNYEYDWIYDWDIAKQTTVIAQPELTADTNHVCVMATPVGSLHVQNASLLETITEMEQERDKWKRKCDEHQRNNAWLTQELSRLRKYVAIHNIPVPLDGTKKRASSALPPKKKNTVYRSPTPGSRNPSITNGPVNISSEPTSPKNPPDLQLGQSNTSFAGNTSSRSSAGPAAKRKQSFDENDVPNQWTSPKVIKRGNVSVHSETQYT